MVEWLAGIMLLKGFTKRLIQQPRIDDAGPAEKLFQNSLDSLALLPGKLPEHIVDHDSVFSLVAATVIPSFSQS